MYRTSLLALLIFVTGCTAPIILSKLEPDPRERCFEQVLPVAYQVCIYDEKSKNPDILYYFHGTGDWVHSFTHRVGTDGSFEQRQKWLAAMRKSSGVPKIITISFGRSYLLNEERLQTFDRIQTIVENELGKFRRRIVMGFSMGGHNALRAFLSKPQLYDRAVILSPNVPFCYPFVSKDALYICNFELSAQAPEMDHALGLAAGFQIKDSYTQADYDRLNPVALLQQQKTILPPVYLSVGTRDQFGFLTGTRKLASLLKHRSKEFVYREIEGGRHNEFDAADISRFLNR